MSNDEQMKYPGGEGYYEQNQQVSTSQPLADPGSQPLSGPSSYTGPRAEYPSPSITASPPPPPVSRYMDPPSPTTQNFGGVSQEKIGTYNQPPKQQNVWKIATLVLLIMVVALGSTTAVLIITRPNSSPSSTVITTVPGTSQSTLATSKPISGQATTPTSVSTSSSTPTAQSFSSNNYSAPQPGPGCDTSGGTWTPQGLGSINCGTRATPASPGTWGYFYLQLPNNSAFSANNKITVTGSSLSDSWISCLGLAEQDANTGFLAEYCPDGTWSIDSISNKGTIIQTLSNSVTSKRTTTTISLALNGNTLSFTIDTESHQITVSPIEPIKVAIGFYNPGCGNCSVLTTNFSYITPAS